MGFSPRKKSRLNKIILINNIIDILIYIKKNQKKSLKKIKKEKKGHPKCLISFLNNKIEIQ